LGAREKRPGTRKHVDGDVSAKSTAKFGATSYEYLTRRARQPLNLVNLGRPLAALMKSRRYRPQKNERADGSVRIEHVVLARHNRRLLPWTGFRGRFGQKYPHRWDQPASCYLDVRIDGKATNGHDLTWSQAASRIGDEAFDNPVRGNTGRKGAR
jgi:hypothetical protein